MYKEYTPPWARPSAPLRERGGARFAKGAPIPANASRRGDALVEERQPVVADALHRPLPALDSLGQLRRARHGRDYHENAPDGRVSDEEAEPRDRRRRHERRRPQLVPEREQPAGGARVRGHQVHRLADVEVGFVGIDPQRLGVDRRAHRRLHPHPDPLPPHHALRVAQTLADGRGREEEEARDDVRRDRPGVPFPPMTETNF